jgi:hypothetical protein
MSGQAIIVKNSGVSQNKGGGKKPVLHAAAKHKSGKPGLLLVSALALAMHSHAVSKPFLAGSA